MENYIEIKTRDGLGRLGEWWIKDRSISIPIIATLASLRFPKFSPCELEISDIKTVIVNLISDLKLKLYFEANPLINEFEKSKETSKLFSPSLMIPGTINYPESFNVEGISLKSIESSIRVESQSIKSDIQIISQDNEPISEDSIILLIMNSMKLFENPKAIVDRILTLNHRAEPNKLLYLPGITAPNNLAVLVYLGVDIIDTTQCILHARSGNLLTNSGVIPWSSLDPGQGLCGCDGCNNLDNNERIFENILKHNTTALWSELGLIKTLIASGRLRELVEQRMLSEPKLNSIVRLIDFEHYNQMEPYFPITRTNRVITCSRESLNRVDIVRFRERVKERYTKPESARILLLLPCSAKKPYSFSKSHKLFRSTIQEALGSGSRQAILHEVIITSPLGLVPRELELVYPAQQYDISVTGHWFEDELKMIRECIIDYLSKNQYEYILIHFNGVMGEYIKSCISQVLSDNSSVPGQDVQLILTSPEHPTSGKSLQNLGSVLKDIVASNVGRKKTDPRHRQLEDLQCIAQYQFGEPGYELLENGMIRGRYPNLKIFKDNTQLGMLTGDRGLISLTLYGAEQLLSLPGFDYTISIDDFKPKGSILAVGVVKANRIIRIGDEVLATYRDELRAVGQAMMSGVEMEKSTRGVGVKVRHHT